MFITTFTSARHLTLPWTRSIQFMHPHYTSWRSTLILSFHLCLGLPSCLFPSGFPTKALYAALLSSIRATCPAYLILPYLTTRIFCEQYRSLTSSLCSCFRLPFYLIPLRPKYSPHRPLSVLYNLFQSSVAITFHSQYSSPYARYEGVRGRGGKTPIILNLVSRCRYVWILNLS